MLVNTKVLLLVVFGFFFSVLPSAYASEEGSGAARIAFDKQVEEYVLPYPGMLPTSPLYFAKTLRDSLIVFLITDPARKAEFRILQSDKHLSSAVALLQEGKDLELALHEIELSNRSSQLALESIKKVQKEKTSTRDIVQKMIIGLHKHEQVLQQIRFKKDEKTKSFVAEKTAEIAHLLKEANAYFPQ